LWIVLQFVPADSLADVIRDRGFRADSTRYEITMSTPAARWADALGYFTIATSTFRLDP